MTLLDHGSYGISESLGSLELPPDYSDPALLLRFTGAGWCRQSTTKEFVSKEGNCFHFFCLFHPHVLHPIISFFSLSSVSHLGHFIPQNPSLCVNTYVQVN